jgi:hypothetical protein
VPALRVLAQEGASAVRVRKPKMTMREWRRARLAAGLLAPACEDCPAASGEWCDYLSFPPAQYIRVDRNPPHVVHSSRAVAAVESGHVPRHLLIAQFAGGELPAGLTAARKTRTARR